MPKGLDYFIDPWYVIGQYKTCPLNEQRRGQPGHGLETVWCHIKNKPCMEGAHNSLVDAKAQMDVFLRKDFAPYGDENASVVPMGEVFGSKRRKQQEQMNEPKTNVPNGWKEATHDNPHSWEPSRRDRATGPAGPGV